MITVNKKLWNTLLREQISTRTYFRELIFQIFFFISRMRYLEMLSLELIFANEKIQLFGMILEMNEKLVFKYFLYLWYHRVKDYWIQTVKVLRIRPY